MHRTRIWMAALVFATAPVAAQSWTAESSGTTETLNSSWYVDALRGWLVGDAGTLRATIDGGQSWTPIQLTNDDLQDVAFRHADLGLIVGDNGRIFRTTDGVTWNAVTSGTTINLTTVAFGGSGIVIAAGRDGIVLRSLDDGATWTVVEMGSVRYRDAVAVGTHAWLVGNDGVVRASSDSGASWFDQLPGTVNDLKGVSFIDVTTGWIAGQNDTLLFTADGGATWTLRNNGIVVGLDSVFFGNASLGWAVGTDGVVYATTNGGLSWVGEPSGTTEALGDVFFSNAFHGVAVGDLGTVVIRSIPDVALAIEPDAIRWDDSSEALRHDVIAGDLALLRGSAGDYALATSRCVADDATETSVSFDLAPGAGQGSFFLVRADDPGFNQSYDSGSFKQIGRRDGGIAASGAGCP